MIRLRKGCRLLLSMLAFTAPAVSAQILTAGDLAQTGVTRLSDILELAENWISSSTEGYHWTIAPLGTSWEASPDWNLFIDGQPIQTQVLNQRSLNVIPVTVAEICEVRLHATPILVHGTLAHGGAIEIFRCTPREGFSIKGQFAAGNETGDPGPYRYTNFGGPNVDRTGPTVHISGAAARQKWFVRITAAADEHHATDPRIRPRVLQLYQGEKDARLFHRSLGVNSQLFGHQIHAGISRMEDLPFVPIMGREIPLNQTIAITSASFFRDRYGYSLVGSSTTFTTRENPDSLLMEGIERRILARAFAVQSILGASQLELGIHASLSEARMDEQLERGRFGSLKVYATLQPDLLYHFYMNAMTAFTLDAGVPGYQLFIQAEHKTSGIEAQLLMRSQALASRVNFSSWVERGHLPHPGTIGVIPLDFEERESMYSADLTWSTGAGATTQWWGAEICELGSTIYGGLFGFIQNLHTDLYRSDRNYWSGCSPERADATPAFESVRGPYLRLVCVSLVPDA